MRVSGRRFDELRQVVLEPGAMPHAEGSCLIRMGRTVVLCSATVESRAPAFLKGSGMGWVTAEYGMLPRATTTRNRREAGLGHPTGRSQEIQRLVGRSLRAAVDRRALGERQIVVDCDVLHADGGTRCASITGGWVALKLACDWLVRTEGLVSHPVVTEVAAVSCGIVAGEALVDLDYQEDSAADADGNFVLAGRGDLVEVQCSAEGRTFAHDDFQRMLALASAAAADLVTAQRRAAGV